MSASDRVLAWATSTGEGLVIFMVAWLLAARLMELVLPEPLAAAVAMVVAAAAGAITLGVEGVRRSAQLRRATCHPSA